MYRKGVSALIRNKNKEFLLVNLESFETRYFSIPGGGLDEGETLEAAIFREIKEELGIGKESLELVGKSDIPIKILYKKIKLVRNGIEYSGQERYVFGFDFLGNDDDIQPALDEVRSYKWAAFDELKNYLLFDNQLEDTSEKIQEIFGN